MVPKTLNLFFTGRTKILKRLHESLCQVKGGEENPSTKVFVLKGMGGAGKSQVSLKFAMDNRERWGTFSHIKLPSIITDFTDSGVFFG